ncbi:rho GTPase-activating protein 190-like isoform X2 [Paramacrobiotus metropolitanus]|uniref:rho GTPase-activating protein 190-like isoform X2 n=1 Tax=Paramacrobiotus metropolitanus TaxID=2943436 RepID=UPI002445F300|nr:rho GTPase-activating protein 190-like isoform X2 [Paramacrobiotus metropolitanus]
MTSLKFSRGGGAQEAPSKAFHVAVIGTCSNEPIEEHNHKDRSSNELYRSHDTILSETGSGKSCLCNRFIRPAEDDYQPTEHVSVLSAADFSSLPISNDHFLYWGDARRTSDDGHDCVFTVIEQTEFIDDSTFQPFRTGRGERDYKRRATNLKLHSPGKIQYFGKSQLGIENEYPMLPLPDGRFNVDGFICCFDVSLASKKPVNRQVENVVHLLNQIVRQKKAAVLAVTKTDDCDPLLLNEANKLLHRKELKGCVHLVETSALKNVNVDAAFMLLAQLIDRNSGHAQLIRYRLHSYEDAASMRKERMDTAAKAYEALVKSQVKERRMTWLEALRKFENDQDFKFYCELWGTDSAKRIFDGCMRQLRDREAKNRLNIYITRLERIFHELLPSLSLVSNGWQSCLDYLQSLPVYDSYFVDLDGVRENVASGVVGFLDDDRFYDMDDARVPSRILRTTDAERCFNVYADTLRREERRTRLRSQFMALLNETPYALPGRPFRDTRVFLTSEPAFTEEISELSTQEMQEIYESHQEKVIEDAKENFIELLLENIALFVGKQDNLKQRKRNKKESESKERASKIAKHEEDLSEIDHVLRSDKRYRAMDLLGIRGKLMSSLMTSLTSPASETCDARYGCFDIAVRTHLARRVKTPETLPAFIQFPVLKPHSTVVKLLILGKNELADSFASLIRTACGDGELLLDGCFYSIDFRIINGDLGALHNAFQTADFLPHGCLCVYDSKETFEYIRGHMEKALVNELGRKDNDQENTYMNGSTSSIMTPCNGLCTVLVFQPQDNLKETEVQRLRERGQDLGAKLQCAFVELARNSSCAPVPINAATALLSGERKEDVLMRHLKILIRDIQVRSTIARSIMEGMPTVDLFDCDIRVRICLLCGDHLGGFAHHILSPLISHTICYRHSKNPQGFQIETFVFDDCRLRIDVDCKSYHESLRAAHPGNIDDDPSRKSTDGYVFVVAVKRRASYCMMRCLMDMLTLQNTLRPSMVIATLDHADNYTRDEAKVLDELKTICEERDVNFVVTTISDGLPIGTYMPLLRTCWEAKVSASYDRASTATLNSTIPSLSDEEAVLIKSRSLEREKQTAKPISAVFANRTPQQRSNIAALSLDAPTFTTFGFEREAGRTRANMITSNDLSAPFSRLATDDAQAGRSTGSVVDMLACPNGHSGGDLAVSDMATGPNRLYSAHDDLQRSSQLRGQRQNVATDALPTGSTYDMTQSATETLVSDTAAIPATSSKVTDAVTRCFVTRSSSALSVSSPIMDDARRILHPLRRGFAVWQAKSIEESPYEREKSPTQRFVGRLAAAGKYASFMDQLNANIARGSQPSPTAPLALPELIEDHEQDPPSDGWEEGAAALRSPGNDRQFLLGLKKRARDIKPPERTRRVAGPVVLPSQHLSISLDDSEAGDESNLATTVDNSHNIKDAVKTKPAKPKREKENKSVKKSKDKKQKKAEVTFESLAPSADNPIPLFIEMCIKFIENRGIDTEGIYRVSGSRVHADQLLHKFLSHPASVDLYAMDIPIYNVTTALKTYLVEQTPPVIPQSFIDELRDANFMRDKNDRIHLIKSALARLTPTHFQLLKYIFAHLRRVSENSRRNKMDVNNLTLCLWPTLCPIEFPNDLARFESVRMEVSEILSTMISSYDKIFEPNYVALPLTNGSQPVSPPPQIGTLAHEAAEAARQRVNRASFNGTGGNGVPLTSPQRPIPPPFPAASSSSNASSSSSLDAGKTPAGTALMQAPVVSSLKSVQV